MKKCEECGKELRFLECYRHPTLGKDSYLCSPCFDQVSDSVARWREFVLANSFDTHPLKMDSPNYGKKIIPNITKIRGIFQTELTEKEINLER